MEHEEYRDEIKAWRQKMDDSLRAEDSWLALAGLFWLSEGSNRMGTDPSSIILLPKRNLPKHVADILLEGDEVILVDALELQDLDYSEFLASLESLSLAVTSHVQQLGLD